MGSLGQSLSEPAVVIIMMYKPVLVLAVLQTCSALNFGRADNDINEQCVDCAGEGRQSRFSMPLAQLGEKKYYLGIFFKANWYKAEQYCRFHGMHLASINSAEEGKFFWMSTGKPVTYENWNAGEPNNFQYENGEQEHCLELWNRDGKGLRWNDTPCSFETFFVCEV